MRIERAKGMKGIEGLEGDWERQRGLRRLREY